MKIRLTLFILFLLQAVSFKAQTNLVVNGSFEEVGGDSKPVGWEWDSNNNITYGATGDVSDIPNGEKVLNINVTKGGQTRAIFQIITTGIVPEEEYEYSFQYNIYRPTSGTNPTYNIGWLDASGNIMDVGIYLSDPFPDLEDAWMLTGNGGLVSPAGATAAYIDFSFDSSIGIYIDDVQFVRTSNVITGLSAVKAQSLFVRSENGNLVVSGAAEGSRIDVYSLVGNRLQSAVAAQGETVIPNLPKGQVLIVRSGNEAAKVAL
jgi:hypothetical protein